MKNIFKVIKNYKLIESKLKNSEEINEELIQELQIHEDYKNITKNIKSILEYYQLWLIEVYFLNNQTYGIFIEQFPFADKNGMITIFTYSLNLMKRVGYASMSKVPNNNRVYLLESLYLEIDSEYRKGHGTKLLQQFVAIAKLHSIEKIYGMLDSTTIIGIDNLHKFYKANGFTINGDTFCFIIK